MATTTKPAPAEVKCSNTGCSNSLDTTGYPKWCQECRTRYKKERLVLKGELTEQRGYARGVREMRELLAEKFSGLGSSNFNGYELAHMVSAFPGPEFEIELPKEAGED